MNGGYLDKEDLERIEHRENDRMRLAFLADKKIKKNKKIHTDCINFKKTDIGYECSIKGKELPCDVPNYDNVNGFHYVFCDKYKYKEESK